MMKLELSPRLHAVAEWIPDGARLADIGTDHAYLPVSLLLDGRLSSAIAADVRPGPLEHAKRTAGEYGVTEQLCFRLCDGLSGIAPEDCDTITIAGMGGETIAHILSAAPWAKHEHTLILQPQSTQHVLRGFLAENGYEICAERIVREGERWYPVLLAHGGSMPPLTPGEQWCGRTQDWVNQPERLDYLNWLLRRTQAQLTGMEQARRINAAKQDELRAVSLFLQGEIERLQQKMR